ncbi:ArsR/SmtB family transcription factor [Frondihabitans australicus]|uniref:ArsR family transcriptional regulator n=1 Tax=Frondihabitans australicus TaxID=386892 RepID=A0A495IIA0_9MICO|nr:helix-turn-helix domain-containing protein [Frondihabitans australicus]RKR75762.1 ArsR family transcriptional regulator [Frondihabitans australicus]
MVVDRFDSDGLDRLFAALSDATRRDIVERVLVTEQSVSSLARRYDMSFAAIQKHVAVLERAALVRKQRRGREQIVRGDVDTIREAESVLERYRQLWVDRADRISDLLRDSRVAD